VALNLNKTIVPVGVGVIIAAAAIFYFAGRDESEVDLTAASEASDVAAEIEATEMKEAEVAVVEPVAMAAVAADDIMAPGPLGEMALGDPNAPNVVIEYASMTCPHCAAFHNEIYGDFKEKYIDTGKVYFIFREFPLDPLATAAFMLARCLPEERYLPLVDILFRQQKNWAFTDDPSGALLNIVKQAGFTQETFNTCLTNQQILDGVNWVKNRGAQDFEVSATPTFFINGTKKSGALSLETLDQEIEPLL
jgi:protein-disulfide isomerase